MKKHAHSFVLAALVAACLLFAAGCAHSRVAVKTWPALGGVAAGTVTAALVTGPVGIAAGIAITTASLLLASGVKPAEAAAAVQDEAVRVVERSVPLWIEETVPFKWLRWVGAILLTWMVLKLLGQRYRSLLWQGLKNLLRGRVQAAAAKIVQATGAAHSR